jgi:serine phosphatase RsbU (regulator of sigma subunit)
MFRPRLGASSRSAFLCVHLCSLASIALPQTVPDQLQRSIDDLSKREITARIRAAQSIGNFGATAAAAVPALVKRLDADYEVWQVKEACAETLGKIGPQANEAIPSLLTALEARRPEVSEAAAVAVGKILASSDASKNVTDAIAALVRRARDPEGVRQAARDSVTRIGPVAVPILLDFILKSGDAMERRLAEQVLTDSMHISLEQAVAYRKLLEDPDAEIRSHFATAALYAVQTCTLGGARCLPQLPKIRQLEVGVTDPTLLSYNAGIKVCEQYLNAIESEQGSGVRGYVVRYAVPLVTSAVVLAMVLGILWSVQSRKGRNLQLLTTKLSGQNSDLEQQRTDLVHTNQDLEERIDEISEQKAAKQRHEIARAVLRRFVSMPSFEDRPAFRIASSFRDSTDVSGDFYNWFSRIDGSILIYLVDVEGSSVEAAIQATHAAVVLERILTRGDLSTSPEVLLEEADRAMQRELGQANIAVTMNLIEVHPDHIRLANAGMPAPLLFRHLQAQPQQMLAAGVYVGGGYSRFRVLPRFTEANVVEGDLLVLFSDGVFEAEDKAGHVFGRHGIESAVARVREKDPKAIAETILTAAAGHAGTELPADDQTVIVVRFGKHSPVGTGAETLVTVRSDEMVAEFTLVNAANAAEVCDSELRRKITDWLPSGRLNRPNRIWCAVWDGLTDALSHGSYRGAIIYIRLRKDRDGIVLELEQPNEWREWYKYLGTERKASLTDLSQGGYPQSDNDVGGTATLLRLADSVTGSMQGRLLTLSFRYNR